MKLARTCRGWSAVLVMLASFPSSAVSSGKHVCISADTGDPNSKGFLASAEGHYRAQGYKVQIGGKLADCMAKASSGDTVLIVAHGYPGGFKWAEGGQIAVHEYNGFGDGTGGLPNPHPLPPPGVCVHMVSCDSEDDPDAEGNARKSVVGSLIAGGRPAFGFPDRVNFVVDAKVNIVNNDPAQARAAERNLKANDQWLNNPPANAPGPPIPNQKSAAETQLAGKPAFATKGYQVTLTYKAPEGKPAAQQGAFHYNPEIATVDSACGDVIVSPGLDLAPGTAPAIGGLGLSVVTLLLGAAGAIAAAAWRRRTGSGPADRDALYR